MSSPRIRLRLQLRESGSTGIHVQEESRLNRNNSDSDLCGSDLAGCDLAGSDLCGSDLSYSIG